MLFVSYLNFKISFWWVIFIVISKEDNDDKYVDPDLLFDYKGFLYSLIPKCCRNSHYSITTRSDVSAFVFATFSDYSLDTTKTNLVIL